MRRECKSAFSFLPSATQVEFDVHRGGSGIGNDAYVTIPIDGAGLESGNDTYSAAYAMQLSKVGMAINSIMFQASDDSYILGMEAQGSEVNLILVAAFLGLTASFW